MKIGRWILCGTMLLAPGFAVAFGPPDPVEMGAERAALFAEADADGNGALSLEEFKTFESLFRDRMAEQHFNHVDANGDGAVSLDELQASGPPPGPRHHGWGR
jgi:hypothetical protein